MVYSSARFSVLSYLLLLVSSIVSGQSPDGYASLLGGTSGGTITVPVSTRSDLVAFAAANQAYVLQISDTIDLNPYEMVVVTDNKTIEGIGSDAMIRGGGLWVQGDNVIIRNLSIGDSYDGDWTGTTHDTDAIRITGQHVWVDHCDLFASANTLIQLQSDQGSVADYVTISHCRFSNQNQIITLGESIHDTTCRGHLRTTIHDCWFDGRHERGLNMGAPRARFGEVHIVNNYYLDVGEECIGAYAESALRVEHNFFRSSDDPHVVREIGSIAPAMAVQGNHYEFTTGDQESYASVPPIPYSYVARTFQDVPAYSINESGTENPSLNKIPTVVTDTIRFDFPRPSIVLSDAILNDTDPDGDELLIAAILNDPGGNALVQDNRIYYYPILHFGPDTILYQIADGHGGTATGMVLVNPIPDSTGGGGTNSISDHFTGIITAYPNPLRTGQLLTINHEIPVQSIRRVSLMDLSGRDIHIEVELSPGQIHISPEVVSSGLYLVRIYTGAHVICLTIRIEGED